MARSKAPNAIDAHVGSRLRMRRIQQAMSQEKLADAFGVSFRQVQKYEKGANRMGASRLQQAADILDVAVPFFFEGAIGGTFTPDRNTLSPAYIDDFVTTSDGLRLAARESVHADCAPSGATSYCSARERDRGRGMRCPTISRSAPSLTTVPRIVGTARPMACTW